LKINVERKTGRGRPKEMVERAVGVCA